MNDPIFQHCDSRTHFTRRGLLKSSALAGMSWLTPFAQQLARGAEKSGGRPRSLIILWMEGGASQLDTFDPHPNSTIAHGAKAIPSAVKGLQLGEGLPLTAELANDFSILRSVLSKEGDHSRAIYNVKTGYRPFPGLVHPAIGSVICHEMPGALGEPGEIDLPSHISILPGQTPGRGGYLGASYDAFQANDPIKPVPDILARTDEAHQRERLDSLAILEKGFQSGRLAGMEESRTMHRTSIERALKMMSSAQLAAFDVSTSPKAERELFGDTPFGRGCLAAGRLIEVGVRCVEVTLKGWDTHANNLEGQKTQLGILDPAYSSLIRWLKERNLYEETIVMVATEFGRTPKLNVAEGRDHWPHGFSVAIGGGGLRGGLAIGATDPLGESEIPEDPVQVENIHATIFDRFGIDYGYELMTPIGRPIAISDGRPIRELL
ncbi:MAG: DUF1501 domain-containing protein [Verrucomicrobiales bacterium]|jgi:hypothetical protein|nr:DUF1501 domain-containing protein [Verrucomicrobiales bacterium]MBP9222912.1 DUF1501 domain-containing protein [Verrucomicrobiales bacterium]HQZ29955.1 DUF1501 domain-containing protein [Verrucomicrobiales bacterium]